MPHAFSRISAALKLKFAPDPVDVNLKVVSYLPFSYVSNFLPLLLLKLESENGRLFYER